MSDKGCCSIVAPADTWAGTDEANVISATWLWISKIREWYWANFALCFWSIHGSPLRLCLPLLSQTYLISAMLGLFENPNKGTVSCADSVLSASSDREFLSTMPKSCDGQSTALWVLTHSCYHVGLRIELRSSSLVTSVFSCWAI